MHKGSKINRKGEGEMRLLGQSGVLCTVAAVLLPQVQSGPQPLGLVMQGGHMQAVKHLQGLALSFPRSLCFNTSLTVCRAGRASKASGRASRRL